MHHRRNCSWDTCYGRGISNSILSAALQCQVQHGEEPLIVCCDSARSQLLLLGVPPPATPCCGAAPPLPNALGGSLLLLPLASCLANCRVCPAADLLNSCRALVCAARSCSSAAPALPPLVAASRLLLLLLLCLIISPAVQAACAIGCIGFSSRGGSRAGSAPALPLARRAPAPPLRCRAGRGSLSQARAASLLGLAVGWLAIVCACPAPPLPLLAALPTVSPAVAPRCSRGVRFCLLPALAVQHHAVHSGQHALGGLRHPASHKVPQRKRD